VIRLPPGRRDVREGAAESDRVTNVHFSSSYAHHFYFRLLPLSLSPHVATFCLVHLAATTSSSSTTSNLLPKSIRIIDKNPASTCPTYRLHLPLLVMPHDAPIRSPPLSTLIRSRYLQGRNRAGKMDSRRRAKSGDRSPWKRGSRSVISSEPR
jgi:hypothetical protein